MAPLAIYKPSLLIRFAQYTPAPLPNLNAEYRLEFNRIKEKPGVLTEMPVVITNTGKNTWRSSGGGPVSLSYHWYDTEAKMILETPSLETPLPHDVRSKETVRLNPKFQTPDDPGIYLLDWDLRYPEYNWFSVADAVMPGVVEANIAPDVDSWRGSGDLSVWFNPPGKKAPLAPTDIPRTQLWRAALVLFARHPILGIGPDNYRLLYGTVLGYSQWNKEIHSNNLYLEILVGSGALGLLAFMLCLTRVPWRRLTEIPPAGVALLHGAFDFFLMTTPLYFAFWLFVGEASQAAKEGD